ncbi:beta strand repeat-containing protein [Rariglobus hedericola]|uniref:PEP-CTERM sorting domain-containing protein n=2 Tax=Rariglobus hedericola TaxID=2597822 RepID=A0A556QSH2_9BACT|nr:autotransporter-associated beta strand repeat-containing protein [Rariglobus hedericola]TSJ79581.1 hypothetical protein FPL22_09935 [Rariglobus hedericola]
MPLHARKFHSLSKFCRLGALVLPALALQPISAQTTGFNQTGAGPLDYNTPANWVGGTINGIWDSSLTLTGNQVVTFAADTTLSNGLNFSYAGNNTLILRGSAANQTVILGGDITVNNASGQQINLGTTTANRALTVDLGGGTRNFVINSGKTLGLINTASHGNIAVTGGGQLKLTGNAATSDISVSEGSSLNFDSSSGTGTTRAKSVTLNRSTLSISGNGTSNSVDTITNALTTGSGASTVTLTATKNTQLVAGSFVRGAGSTVLFRGTGLGTASVASATAATSNIVFNSTVGLLTGSGSSGTTIGIIAGAYGDTSSAGSGFATGGLVTYDAANGVRLLGGSEYTGAIINGQTQLDNVRYVATSGSPISQNLTSALSTINSLSFSITGAGTNSGVTLSGDAGSVLKIDSGVIYAYQGVTTAAATDAITLAVPTLNFNGKEAILIVSTTGDSNNRAPLAINSEITNATGLTKSGPGVVFLGGTAANSYTGTTTVNAGTLVLSKGSDGTTAITGDLVINGGSVQNLKNEQIADTANVTINSGTYTLQYSNFGGSYSETINNLSLNGGIINTGFIGKNNSLTLNNLAITNTAFTAYTPVILAGGDTAINGSKMVLKGNLTFVGNTTNTNTAVISTASGHAFKGAVALDGIRTFTIGDGAAATDLTVTALLTNNASTTGGLTKTGLGTLALTAVNTYTGATNVNQGVLLLGVANALSTSSPISLGGGTLNAGGFSQSLGTVALTANSTIDLGTGDVALLFAASNAVSWSSSVSLSFVNVNAGDTIQFGSSNTALTSGQLAQITINGFAAMIDGNGFLTASAIPEPSTYAFFAGMSLLVFAGVRRGNRSSRQA